MTKEEYLLLRQNPYSEGNLGPLLFNYAVKANDYKETFDKFVVHMSQLLRALGIFETDMIEELVNRSIDFLDGHYNLTLVIHNNKTVRVV